MEQHVMRIAWPAFLVAGVMEMVVFALVDPNSLQGLLDESMELSRLAVYTVVFFVFWAVAMLSSALTDLLGSPPPAPSGAPPVESPVGPAAHG